MASRDLSEVWIQALNRADLDPGIRTVAFLRYRTGLSEPEIARLTGIACEVVVSRIGVARERLRALALRSLEAAR